MTQDRAEQIEGKMDAQMKGSDEVPGWTKS